MKINRSMLFLFSSLMLLSLAGGALAADPVKSSAALRQPTALDGSSATGNGARMKPPKHRADAILVKFKTEVPEGMKDKLHKHHGSRVEKKFDRLRMHRVKLKEGISLEETLEKYKAEPDVEYAEPDYILEPARTPNEPAYNDGYLWGLWRIDAPAAWNVTTGSADAVVAVIDSGIDYNHPDLAANIWTNPGLSAGYLGDVHGIDTFNDDTNPMDDQYHGTHVAGTIGAVGDNNTGVAGVNWQVKLLPCKFIGAGDFGYASGAIECLDYVKAMKDQGVNIVATNNSWGSTGGYSQALYDAIAAQQDILFIAAAGNEAADNDQAPSYPANYKLPNIISVAASDIAPTPPYDDRRASFTNFGRESVHVAAPGDAILSTIPTGYFPATYGGYGYLSGTSMAAPHVAGLAALLRSTGKDWKQTKNLILSGADPVSVFDGVTITGRRINAGTSLACSDRPLFALTERPDVVQAGAPVALSVISINCGDPAGPVSATLSGGETLQFLDDGVAPDQAADDGLFTATWTPAGSAGVDFTFNYPGGSQSVQMPSVALSGTVALAGAATVSENVISAQANLNFSATFAATGGTAPYSWSLASGLLPAGITLNGSTGEISGAASTTGSFPFAIRVTDARGGTDSADWQLVLSAGAPILPGDQGDLQVIAVSGTLAAGKLTYSATVKNFGKIPTASSSTGIYLSKDGTASSSGYLVTKALTASLQAGGQVVVNGTASVPATVPTGTYPVAAIADINGAILESDEGNNGATGNGIVLNSDLSVTALSGTLSAGKLTYSVTVQNAGTGSPNVPVALYFSADGSASATDLLISQLSAANIAAGTSRTFTGTASIPGTMPSGSYFLAAVADPANLVAETDEGNNGAVASQFAIDTELQVVAVSGTLAGGKLSYSVTVRNAGNIGTAASSTGIYLSADGTASPTALLLVKAGTSAIAAGGQLVLNGTATVPATTAPGTYTVAAIADITALLSESDEGNNGGTGNTVLLSNDLSITALSGTLATGKLTYSVTVQNSGTGNPSVPVALYFSADASPSASDLLISQLSAASIPAGTSRTFAGTVAIPGTMPSGTYYLAALADPAGSVPEANESDNGQVASQFSVGSDLQVSAASGTLSGGKLTYSVTIQNAGNIPAAASSTGIYLSADGTASTAGYLITKASTASIAAGGQLVLNGTAAVAATIPPGSYSVAAIADINAILSESSEGNNGGTGNTVSLSNDLSVTALSGTLAAGKLTYSVTVQNSGTGNPSVPVGLYFSADANAAATDLLISLLSAASIPAGTSKTFSGTVTVPGTVPSATYYLAALADPANAVAEANETNNGAAATQFSVDSDLEITAVSGTLAGGKLTYSITVLNSGNIGAAASSTGIYLSGYLLTKASTAAIAAGAQVVLSGTATVPATVPPGSYAVAATADLNAILSESNEGNNAATGNSVLLSNDLSVTALSGTLSAGKLTYSVTVQNTGTGNPSVPVGLYFSADGNASSSDLLISQLSPVSVAAGTSRTLTGTVTVPGTLPSGTYSLAAVADPAGIVPETLESNNGMTATQFSVGNDLQITALTGSIAAGKLSYSITLRNNGNIPAAASSTGVYLSLDGVASTTDYLVTKANTGSIAAGGQLVVSGTVTVPSVIPAGTYTLAAIADILPLLAESDEANNGAVGNLVTK